jgi:hypothetical protein
MKFLTSFLSAMRSADRSEEDLPSWFAFPVDFYAAKGLTDQSKLFGYLDPPPPEKKTNYAPPVPLEFKKGPNADKLVVRVDWVKPDGREGSSRVTYLLTPFRQGEPYRISYVDELRD